MQYQMLLQLQQMASTSSEDAPIDVEQLLKGMSAEDQKALIDYAQKNMQSNLLKDGMNFDLPQGIEIPPAFQELADHFGQSQGGKPSDNTSRSSGPELRQRSTRPGAAPASTQPRTSRPSSSSEKSAPSRPQTQPNVDLGRPNDLRPRTQSQGSQTQQGQTQNFNTQRSGSQRSGSHRSDAERNPRSPANQQPSTSLPRRSQPSTTRRGGAGELASAGAPSAQAIKALRSLAEQNPELAKQVFRSLANRRSSGSQNSSAAPQPGIPRGPDSTPGLDAGSLQELLGGNGDSSMQDLLRQMASNPSRLPPIEDLAGMAGAAKDAAGGYAQPLSQQLKSMVDGDLARKVERTGLGRTLSGLLKEARRAPAPKTGPSSATGASTESENQSLSSSLEKSVLTTLDGFGKSLLGKTDKKKELASASGNRAAAINKKNGSSGSQPRTAGKANDSSQPAEKSKPSFFKSAAKSASKAIDGFVSRDNQSQSTQPSQKDPRPSSTANADGPGMGSLPDATGFGGLVWAVLGLAALAAVLWFAFRSRLTTLLADNSQLPFPAEALRRIRTHADVIAAFHAIAYRASGQTQPWWTHRRAVDELAKPDSTVRTAWERLAGLYEESRYMQGKQALSPEQAERAEQAIRTLAQAPVNA